MLFGKMWKWYLEIRDFRAPSPGSLEQNASQPPAVGTHSGAGGLPSSVLRLWECPAGESRFSSRPCPVYSSKSDESEKATLPK